MLGIPFIHDHDLWIATPKEDCSKGAAVLVFGHSVWCTSDGFIALPQGSQVGFYSNAGENINAQRAKAMLWNVKKMKNPDSIYEQYRQVQNLRLLPAPEHLGNVRAALEYSSESIPIITSSTDEGVTLERIVKYFPNKYIIWLGCRGMQII